MTSAIKATRRNLLALAGGAAVLGATRPAAAAVARHPLDLSTQAARLRAYMLMRGALDDQLVIGCISGRYYGVVDSEVKPLFGVVSGTFARYRANAGGGYDGASYEVSFFTDLDSGKALDSFANPYTGQTVTVPHTNFPPAKIVIGSDLSLTVPTPPPGLTMDDHVRMPQVLGDDVWMVEETFTAFQMPGIPKPIRYSEITTMHARRADLENRAAKRVPCQTGFENIVSWRPWLAMADHPGHLTCNGFGKYGVGLNALPANWLAAAAVLRPDVLKDPAAPLDALMKA